MQQAPRQPVSSDPILVAAQFMAQGDPAGWRQLLAEHTPDTTGHCGGCPTSRFSPVWPCGLWAIADAAARIASRQPVQRRR